MSLSNSNSKIAKNTLIIYARVFITMCIGLLTSRYILTVLGASDYGLYNVVGGIVALFSFISGSLTGSTTRFINYEVGKQGGNINKVFNKSLTLHLCIAAIILIVVELLGVFYINHYLKVEPDKLGDAIFIFHFSAIISCIGIAITPFQSVIIANERFLDIAIIDLLSTIAKLILVLSLFKYQGNTLRLYAIYMCIVNALMNFSYYAICKRCWPSTIRWNMVKSVREYKDLLVFINFDLLSSASLAFRSQGSSMLINYFFGTMVNAAYAIAYSVQQYVNVLVGNFDSAVAPQMVQSIGAGDINRAGQLAMKTCRFCILILMLAFFPLYTEIDFILQIWLGEVPDGASVLTKYTLVVALVSSTSAGLTRLVDGIGKIKWFKIEYAILYFSCIPIGFILYKIGCPPSTIILLFIISDLINRVLQFVLLRKIVGFPVVSFIKESYTRPLVVLILMVLYSVMYGFVQINTAFGHCLGMLVTLTITAMLAYFVGVKASERAKVLSFVKSRLHP